MLEKIKISIHSSDNFEVFKNYTAAYANIVAEFGEHYHAFVSDWYQRPNTYCCILSNTKDEVIGGYTLQVHQANYTLAIQQKDTPYTAAIASFIRSQNHFELCEGNGFFVVPEYRRSIVSQEIVRSSLFLVMQLNLNTMIGIALEQTTRLFNAFQIIETRQLMYPDQYFCFANNPKSFVFEIQDLTNQIKQGMNKRSDAYILSDMLTNRTSSYILYHGDTRYEFCFENHIN